MDGTRKSFLLFSCIFKGLNQASFWFDASSRDWIGLPFIFMHLQGTVLGFLLFLYIFLFLFLFLLSSYQYSLWKFVFSFFSWTSAFNNIIWIFSPTSWNASLKWSIFGLIHILIGSDILWSPRGFGPFWILKTCLDFSTYLFHHEWGN